MATALQGLRLTARSCQCKPHAKQYLTKSIGRRRAFSTAAPLWADSRTSKPASTSPAKPAFNKNSERWDIPEEAYQEYQEALKHIDEKKVLLSDEDVRDSFAEEFQEHASVAGNAMDPTPAPRRTKLKETFLNMGDPEPFEDENFDLEADTHEDVSALGHGELEHHRERRHYARLAAWEMPLLSKYAKPFVPPTADMPLRFRYTTYMGEQHPAEKKVVMEFCTQDMPNLTDVQRLKLIKLAGVRYNPETDIVKMSCEMFPSQAQNKRYLGDLVDQMLREAKDPKDTFEDVPVDMRHHKFKPKPKFPTEWIMTEKRREELAKLRENAELRDQRRMLTGQLVDGIKQIEEAWAKSPAPPAALPEMAMAGRGGKRLAVKR